jgi:coenzyme F420-0:L-glutamate ligase/coenzyme F420-1:gamma-L-glutamate ligase
LTATIARQPTCECLNRPPDRRQHRRNGQSQQGGRRAPITGLIPATIAATTSHAPTPRLAVYGLEGIAEISAGDDLATAIGAAIDVSGCGLLARDVVVVAQKIVSKAEGRRASLRDFLPSARAIDLATQCGKDPRLVEAVLSESTEVLRARMNVLIVRHRLGLVMAQAGVDQSNVPGDDSVLLLPVAPDASARELRRRLGERFGVDIAS